MKKSLQKAGRSRRSHSNLRRKTQRKVGGVNSPKNSSQRTFKRPDKTLVMARRDNTEIPNSYLNKNKAFFTESKK